MPRGRFFSFKPAIYNLENVNHIYRPSFYIDTYRLFTKQDQPSIVSDNLTSVSVHTLIDNLVLSLEEDKAAQMATMMKRIEDDSELTNSNVVKVVTDKNGYAVYFSRYAIPYNRTSETDPRKRPVYYKHIGIYALTKDFLFQFKIGRASCRERV